MNIAELALWVCLGAAVGVVVALPFVSWREERRARRERALRILRTPRPAACFLTEEQLRRRLRHWAKS